MLVNTILSLHRMVLLAVLALALVAPGFAHRAPGPQDEALAYAQQIGISISDICGGEPGKAQHPGSDCAACRIAHAADLPPLTGARIDLELAADAAGVVPREVRAILHRSDPAHPPQGPPVA